MKIRLLSLLIPASASGIGFFCFSVLAFGFTELSGLPEGFRRALVLVGAFALAFGAEVGTLASVVEIYRKGEDLGRWDKSALVVSVLATFGAFVLSFAELLGARATWGATVQLYGPVVLGLLAALDSYGGFMELGLYLYRRDAEERARISTDLQFKIWYAQQQAQARRELRSIERELMDDTQPIVVPVAEVAAQPTREPARTSANEPQVSANQAQPAANQAPTKREPARIAVMSIAEWRELTRNLNGNRATLTAKKARTMIEAAGRTPPAESTLRYWVKSTKEVSSNGN